MSAFGTTLMTVSMFENFPAAQPWRVALSIQFKFFVHVSS